jgi:hypothetical protein
MEKIPFEASRLHGLFLTMIERVPTLPLAPCPVCDAPDAYIEQRPEKDDYFVECPRCTVYTATRKAFRHFEYLRWRGDADGLQRLDRLAHVLKARRSNATIRLEYDSWQALLDLPHDES